MRQRGIKLDNTLCFVLLRLCYNRLREEWYPGGYPPTPDKHPHHMPGQTSPAGRHLIQVHYKAVTLSAISLKVLAHLLVPSAIFSPFMVLVK